jgi:hypothetical protein
MPAGGREAVSRDRVVPESAAIVQAKGRSWLTGLMLGSFQEVYRAAGAAPTATGPGDRT